MISVFGKRNKLKSVPKLFKNFQKLIGAKMVGDFMVCVDRLIASATCFDSSSAAISSDEVTTKAAEEAEESPKNCGSLKIMKFSGDELKNNVSECRICQEEGDEAEMEAPCACNGTLKFAHRKCIQRWCNKKGDITCEICNQEYAPNYAVPLTRASDVIAIDIRQGWGGRLDLNDAQLIAIQQEILNSEYEDYASAHNSGIACCRSVALILMLLLLLRHILVVIRDTEMLVDASDFVNLTFQFAGFLLPCYLIVRSCYILHTRRRRRV